jgi:opacity protein-like surface antigen
MRRLRLALLACGALSASQAVSAQDSGPSEGNWELGFGPVYALSKKVNFQGGSTVELANNTGGRLGVAFYMTDEFSIGADFAYSRAKFNAHVIGNSAPNLPPSTVAIENGRTEFSTLNFTGAYHLLDGPIRPFGLVGLGWNLIHTNISTLPPQVGCWWDPWYGYICTAYQPNHGSGSLSYQAGLGVQLNFGEHFGVNVDYRETWIELHNANGTPGFGSVEAMFVWRFGEGYY